MQFDQKAFEQKMAATYERCLTRERTREWKYRHTQQGAFESGFVRIDQLASDEDFDLDKLRIAGSLGSAILEPDEQPATTDHNRLKHACEKLRRHGRGHLVRTLQLIAKNGSNRKESIWALMRETNAKRKAKDTSLRSENTTATSVNSASSTASKSRPKKRQNCNHPKKS